MNTINNSMYVSSLDYARVKEAESECFRNDKGVRQGFITSPWLLNVYMYAVMREVKMEIGKRGWNGKCLAYCIQINWFYVASCRNT